WEGVVGGGGGGGGVGGGGGGGGLWVGAPSGRGARRRPSGDGPPEWRGGRPVPATPLTGDPARAVREDRAMPIRLDSRAADFAERFRAFLASKRETSADVEAAVRAIIADVAARGDRAVIELTRRFDRFDPAH